MPAGRPRDPAKHEAIILAARETFFERGFSAATIEDIAQRAGVSKVTIYKRFGDKETLFEQVVRAQAEFMVASLEGNAEVAPDAPLPDRLNAYGMRLMHFLLHPDHVAMDRIIAQELAPQPELTRRFFEAGPGDNRRRLAAVLAEEARQGTLEVEDPLAAAEDLFSLWKGFADMELRFGVRSEPKPGEIERRVQRGTALFMRLYGK